MIKRLFIKDFAIINELELSIKDGLTIITGETGAGKSIIIEGLKLALGAKNQTNLNLKDGEISSIKAVFEILGRNLNAKPGESLQAKESLIL